MTEQRGHSEAWLRGGRKVTNVEAAQIITDRSRAEGEWRVLPEILSGTQTLRFQFWTAEWGELLLELDWLPLDGGSFFVYDREESDQ